jgi:hypothetical protein
MRVFLCGVAGIVCALSAQVSLFAQGRAVAVPFVGCKSDGQTGPLEPPKGKSQTVGVSQQAARRLAYYVTNQGLGVLAPRGWYCFGRYGSSGDDLFVSAQRIDTANILALEPREFAGPAIWISRTSGQGSGRTQLAEVIAAAFPKYKSYVTGVIEEFGQEPSSFPLGPYSKDTMTYKGETVVEYRTPGQTDGLGTHLWRENPGPVDGVVILDEQSFDLLFLSVRLPSDLSDLAPAIMSQVEREASQLQLR